jgi:hypothetical protein
MCTDAGVRERMMEVTDEFPAENRLRPRRMMELPETRAYERKASDPVFARKDCFHSCIFAGVIWPSFMHLACASHSSRPLDPIDNGRRRCDMQTKNALGIPAPFDYTEESPQDLEISVQLDLQRAYETCCRYFCGDRVSFLLGHRRRKGAADGLW